MDVSTVDGRPTDRQETRLYRSEWIFARFLTHEPNQINTRWGSAAVWARKTIASSEIIDTRGQTGQHILDAGESDWSVVTELSVNCKHCTPCTTAVH